MTIFARRQRQPNDMEETRSEGGQGRPEGEPSEFGAVRVFFNPAPDAEDRLSRLFKLLLRPSANDRQAALERGSPLDDRHTCDHPDPEPDPVRVIFQPSSAVAEPFRPESRRSVPGRIWKRIEDPPTIDNV